MSLLDLLKQKQQDLAAGRRKKTVKPPSGRSRWRIAGSWRGANQQFWHDFGQHFVKDAAGDLKAVYICVDKTYGHDCDICNAIAQGIKGATDDATMELLKNAKAAGRVLLNAVQLDGPNAGQMQILEVGPTLFENIVKIAAEWEEAGETIFGPSGKDLIIDREGTGLNTKYAVQAAAKAMPVNADVFKVENLHNLDEYVKQESAEAQQRALANVRSVAGLLPAPSAAAARSSGLPVAAAAGATIDEDYDAPATPPARKPAAAPAAAAAQDVEFEDVPVSVDKPAAKPAAAPAPAAANSDDPEIDDLLASLG